MLGRVDVKPDDIADLLDEPRIVGELKGFRPMRLQAVFAPDAVNGGGGQPAHLRHRTQCPVRRCGQRRLVQGPLDNGGHLLGRGGGEGTAAWRIAEQPISTVAHVALLPAPDCGLALSGHRPDRHRSRSGGGHQHDPGTPDMMLRAPAIRNYGLQPFPVSRPKPDFNAFPHATRLAYQAAPWESSTAITPLSCSPVQAAGTGIPCFFVKLF